MKLRFVFLALSFCWRAEEMRGQKIRIDNHTFTFSGYGRTGIGASQDGATQAEFWAPGAQSKYRLGNEAHSYLEVALNYEYMLNPEKGKSFELVYMGSGYSNFGETSSFGVKDINQLYVKMNNIYKDIDVWVGRRYYYRKSIQLQDHWWLNPSGQAQAGAGVEGLRGKNKPDDIKIALFNYEDSAVGRGVNGYEDKSKKKGLLNSYELEGRWVDIPLARKSHVNFWANYSIRAANKKWGYDTRQGFGIGIWHEQKELFGRKAQNIAAISFRKGPSVMQRNTYSYIPNRENMEKEYPDIINYDLNNLYSFEVNDNILYENDKKYALEGSLIYRYENQGVVPHDKSGARAVGKDVHWFSAGFRYLHYLSRHFNLALEIGSDYVDNKTHIDRHPKGWLTKFTFSPQISWDYGYSAHPVVRPFITYALWDKSMQGLVGNTPGSAPYDNKTRGFSFGVQIETSW